MRHSLISYLVVLGASLTPALAVATLAGSWHGSGTVLSQQHRCGSVPREIFRGCRSLLRYLIAMHD